jgi:hypothetical protein
MLPGWKENWMKAAVIYWSKTGNTERVAQTIIETLESAGAEVVCHRAEEAGDIDWFAYDLICLGFPSYRWRPPAPVDDLLNTKFGEYRRLGRVKVGAPRVPGKHVVVFCTYSGPHTGLDEAIPAGKYAAQFFDHLGLEVAGEWYVVGEFHGSEEASTRGRLGDIRGRPNADDLAAVHENVNQLVARLGSA